MRGNGAWETLPMRAVATPAIIRARQRARPDKQRADEAPWTQVG